VQQVLVQEGARMLGRWHRHRGRGASSLVTIGTFTLRGLKYIRPLAEPLFQKPTLTASTPNFPFPSCLQSITPALIFHPRRLPFVLVAHLLSSPSPSTFARVDLRNLLNPAKRAHLKGSSHHRPNKEQQFYYFTRQSTHRSETLLITTRWRFACRLFATNLRTCAAAESNSSL